MCLVRHGFDQVRSPQTGGGRWRQRVWPRRVGWVDEIARLLLEQSGVVSRRQVLVHGGRPADIERALRRREWVRLLPGVFLDHTGQPSWVQRAWAGVLFYQPAALGGLSALRAVTGPGWRRHPDHLPIEIVVDVSRTVQPVDGFRPRRRSGLDEHVLWNASPPRVRVEQAALDVASRTPSELDTVALLADVCQLRRTTAQRLIAALAEREQIVQRDWLGALLRDIADGTNSVLEHGYLRRVERAHALPRAERQRGSVTGPRRYRDATYTLYGLVVELDSRLFHDSAQDRDADLDRDLDAAVDRLVTVRLGWGQVFGRPCRTVTRVAVLLRQRGWTGSPRPCGLPCDLA
jgi:hypothetical protein